MQLVELDFSNLIFQISSTDQQGDSVSTINKWYLQLIALSDLVPERIYNSHYGNGVPAMFIS